jgi:hypothetical protein
VCVTAVGRRDRDGNARDVVSRPRARAPGGQGPCALSALELHEQRDVPSVVGVRLCPKGNRRGTSQSGNPSVRGSRAEETMVFPTPEADALAERSLGRKTAPAGETGGQANEAPAAATRGKAPQATR